MRATTYASRSVGLLALVGATLALAVALTASQQPAAPAPGQPGQAQPPSAAPADGAKPQAAGPTGFAASPALKFRAQEIATDFGVGYAVAAGDVNGDKQIDVLAISGTELVWFKAPT